MWGGLVCGVGLALLNGLIAWLSIRWTWNSPPQRFFKLFFGGMVLRFVLTVAASAALLLVAPVDPGYFVAGLGAIVAIRAARTFAPAAPRGLCSFQVAMVKNGFADIWALVRPASFKLAQAVAKLSRRNSGVLSKLP